MKNIAFIGAGNMNSAIITGLVKTGYAPANIMVSNPSPEKRVLLANTLKILETDDNLSAANFADIIVLGVKPHFVAQVCQQISAAVDVSNKCFISVAAGCAIETIEQALNKPCAVIRTMPNTPSQLGLGVTGLFASPQANQHQIDIAEQIMSAVGMTKWLDHEAQIDQITAISGSGPAYFFLFMEAMEKQAQAFGFNANDSRQLVQQTALGAVSMAIDSKLPLSQLRNNVTSKGGTTQAALTTLIDGGLEQLVTKAMNSALQRAKEMAQNNQ